MNKDPLLRYPEAEDDESGDAEDTKSEAVITHNRHAILSVVDGEDDGSSLPIEDKAESERKYRALERVKVFVRHNPLPFGSAIEVSNGMWQIIKDAGVVFGDDYAYSPRYNYSMVIRLKTSQGPYNMIVGGYLTDEPEILVTPAGK